MAHRAKATARTVSAHPEPAKKSFTILEANQAIPYVVLIARDMMICFEEALKLHEELQRSREHKTEDEIQVWYKEDQERMDRLRGELHLVGAKVLDLSQGLFEFPSTHAGRRIRLCWKYGSRTVSGWLEDGSGNVRPKNPLRGLGLLG